MTEVLDPMEKKHCKLDSHTIITIFQALVLRGFIHQAPIALEEMKTVWFVLNRMSYNGLISILLRYGFHREAMDVHRKMISEGRVPSMKFYSALVGS